MGVLNMESKDRAFGKLLLKKKTFRIKKGDRKGEEEDVLSGSIHLGQGKMMKISLTVRSLENGVIEFESDGKDIEGVFVNVSKWKGEAPKKRSSYSKSPY